MGLIEELRSDARCGCYADGAGTATRPAVSYHCVTCRAADRIAELEAALRPFAKAADNYAGLSGDGYCIDNDATVTVGDLREARAVLSGKP